MSTVLGHVSKGKQNNMSCHFPDYHYLLTFWDKKNLFSFKNIAGQESTNDYIGKSHVHFTCVHAIFPLTRVQHSM